MSNALDRTAEKRALVARLLRERAASARESDSFAHRLFEAQARRTPDAVAVVGAGTALTYRELDGRANRIAHALRRRGIGPESRVALCVERTPALVAALLGILKAGGAYIPLDPSYPADRLAYMLDDSRAAVLLTEAHLEGGLPAGAADVLRLDADAPALIAESDRAEGLDAPLAGGNLAYVIYTSGSTGRPKGVQVTHGALANFLKAMAGLLGMTERDALLAVTTLSFDIAALELFLPLSVGARLELAGRDEASDGARLIERLADPGVTFLQATPATWRLLLESGWAGSPGLTMLCGGEALPRALADRLLGNGKALWNLYGPTETTIWSSAARIEADGAPIAIGRPIRETQLYVLDARFRPVPIGIAGELYIGGSGLARGYLGRPGLTAERFLPDPIGAVPGGRLYRTGDLARWRPDGRLECLGRVDHQVKIRGFRIELGEIEAVLAEHPTVREAVVVAREDTPGDARLVGYVVPRGDAVPTASALRDRLRERLPDYMVPAALVVLDALPTTPNGKVDRRALPAPEEALLAPEDGFVAPRGPLEEAVAEIWGAVLNRPRVGIRENFFDLGGHSLIATQIITRLRDLFGVELALRDLWDEPTVAGLARRLDAALRDASGTATPPLKPVPRVGDPPASFAQQRLWFLDQWEPGTALYNIPIALRLTGAIDVPAMERALNEVIARHEALRTTFRAVDGQPRQVIAPSLALPWEFDDLGDLPEDTREADARRRLIDEANRPFDLARGPLIRARLLRLDDRDHLAVVTLHHIVADGWSFGVLIREMAVLYDACTRGAPSPLPPLPVQYADFALWQRDWLRGDALRAQLDYWQAQLAGVPVLEFPTDRPRPPAPSGRGGLTTRLLPRALVDDLRALSRSEGATLFMTVLAVFQTLLHRYSNQDDIAVGTPIAGRNRPELEDLIGFFANTLVLRGDLAGDPSLRVLIRRTRQAALGAYAHQDVPFDQLVGTVPAARDAGRSPLFQVMLILQNAPLPAFQSPDLALTPIEVANGTAKFDLTLYLVETADGLTASLEYSADLFEAATADRLLGHFRTLLESAVADPDRSIGALAMLSEAEQKQLLGQGGDDDEAEALAALDGLSDEELDAFLSGLSSEGQP